MTKTDPTLSVPSPCIGNCCLNSKDICVGCFRSLTEITQWSQASNAKRLKIIKNIRRRKADSEQ